jgi:hypothetical protein
MSMGNLPLEVMELVVNNLPTNVAGQLARTNRMFNAASQTVVNNHLRDPGRLLSEVIRTIYQHGYEWAFDAATRCCYLQQGSSFLITLNRANVDAIVYVSEQDVVLLEVPDFIQGPAGFPLPLLIIGVHAGLLKIPKTQQVRAGFLWKKAREQKRRFEPLQLSVVSAIAPPRVGRSTSDAYAMLSWHNAKKKRLESVELNLMTVCGVAITAPSPAVYASQ